jgi:transposase-like protein
MKEITAEAKEAYLKSPNHCPFCGSDNIEAGSYDGSSQEVRCHSCGEGWHDITKIVDIAPWPNS